MTNILVNIHMFPGFYESALSAQVDSEIESIFNTDDSGCNSNIPDEFYRANIDYSSIHAAQAREYTVQWLAAFHEATGIKLDAEYESFTSPREYNFETDRLFIHLTPLSVARLFEASEADNHKQLEIAIKDRFTSYDGFLSSYTTNIGAWLQKPVATWDHNELGTLLDAVLAIHYDEKDIERDFSTWDLMENFQCNGGLNNACSTPAIPQEFFDFADAQRELGEAANFELWKETGQAYPENTTREDIPNLPPKPCKITKDLFEGVTV